MFSLLVFPVRQSWVQASLRALLLNYLTITFSKSRSLLVPNLQLFMQRKKDFHRSCSLLVTKPTKSKLGDPVWARSFSLILNFSLHELQRSWLFKTVIRHAASPTASTSTHPNLRTPDLLAVALQFSLVFGQNFNKRRRNLCYDYLLVFRSLP